MADFKKMLVWQRSMEIVTKIYNLTRSGPMSKDFGLKDQLQRSAVSIPSNIAEGEESLSQISKKS